MGSSEPEVTPLEEWLGVDAGDEKIALPERIQLLLLKAGDDVVPKDEVPEDGPMDETKYNRELRKWTAYLADAAATLKVPKLESHKVLFEEWFEARHKTAVPTKQDEGLMDDSFDHLPAADRLFLERQGMSSMSHLLGFELSQSIGRPESDARVFIRLRFSARPR